MFKIDDPLDAWPMHGACGMWALLWIGLMAEPNYMRVSVLSVESY